MNANSLGRRVPSGHISKNTCRESVINICANSLASYSPSNQRCSVVFFHQSRRTGNLRCCRQSSIIYVHCQVFLSDRSSPPPLLQEPWDELFLWAVLNCRQQVARHVWTRTSSPVTFAVMATAVYRHYHDSTSSDNNHMRDMFDAYFQEFKQLSVEVN